MAPSASPASKATRLFPGSLRGKADRNEISPWGAGIGMGLMGGEGGEFSEAGPNL
jgi:hypothetical protein